MANSQIKKHFFTLSIKYKGKATPSKNHGYLSARQQIKPSVWRPILLIDNDKLTKNSLISETY